MVLYNHCWIWMCLSFICLNRCFKYQGCSHRYGWPGFNRTIFEATTTFLPIFTNSVAHSADRLEATRPQLTELEIDSVKAMLPSLQSTKVSWEPILITEKWRWKSISTLARKDWHYMPYAAAFGSITPYCNCTTSNLMATALNIGLVYSLED